MGKILNICTAIIVCISAIDIYWLSKNRGHMIEMEKNPIGKWLLQADNGDVSLFIFCKFLGTFLVIGAIYLLSFHESKYTRTVAISIAIAQIILLCYLYS
tara:strand:- start:416 stop:715 length:300 start_codon:yes stop_codon:yes gene_type:complete